MNVVKHTGTSSKAGKQLSEPNRSYCFEKDNKTPAQIIQLALQERMCRFQNLSAKNGSYRAAVLIWNPIKRKDMVMMSMD